MTTTVEGPQDQNAALELRMEGIKKSFNGFRALDNVSISVKQGQVLAIAGENGAGKSTLVKILSGAYRADEGTINLFGEDLGRSSPREMLDKGVVVIHQELSLAPHLSVAENIFLGRLPRKRGGVVDWAEAIRRSQELLDRLHVNVSPRALVKGLSIADRQMVEIAKALTQQVRLMVLDEPSAVLGDQELEQLFKVVRGLVADGVAIIYISHRLDEIFDVADRVTVLRDGQHVVTSKVGDVTKDGLISYMVGRTLQDLYPAKSRTPGEETLSATGLSNDRLTDVSFKVHRGEIVGIAGLAGSGRTEILRAIFGADPIHTGTVELDGVPVSIRSPRNGLRRGLGLVPEDRKDQALFLNQTIRFNINVARLRSLSRFGVVSTRQDNQRAQSNIARFKIRASSQRAKVRSLSGGNQQKCVLARFVDSGCRVLLIDEPTRGVDVGAKQEIYGLLAEIASQGASVLMVSSELPEILGLSDRVLVMHEGRVAAVLPAEGLTEETVMRYATGTA
jgi:ribose transport system ATP-binding protein